MENIKKYEDLTGHNKLNQDEMFNLKGGYEMDYGCESYVCAIKRSGASEECKDAYCRSAMGPSTPKD